MVLRHLPTFFVAFLLILVADTHAAPESGTTPTRLEEMTLGSLTPRGTRRVIYNSDLSNTTCHLSEPEAKPEELREVVRNYATAGAIDTLVQEIWHQGWSTFWRTDKCPYDSRLQHERLVPIMDTGIMPVEIYIDECHKQNIEFIAGFRMNDRHGHNPDLFEKIAEENPEWILTEYAPTSSRTADPRSRELGCAFDFSQQGVRDWLFPIMEEVAHRFDVDGIEFNFTRMIECFHSDQAEQSHPIMTGFVRRVRAMLDEAGQEKGRQLILGVRVPQTIEGNKRWGLDIPTWIKEGLINYVAPGDIGFSDFNAKYEEFVRLARAHDCYVYPQVECRLGYARWMKSNRTEFQSPDQYRAVLRNIYGAGADGFSTQNYFLLWGPSTIGITGPKFSTPGESGLGKRGHNYPQALNTLKILRDPNTVAAGDRHYVFCPLWGPDGRGPGNTYRPERLGLKRDSDGQRGQFRFRMCENLPVDSKLDGEKVEFGAMLLCKPGIVPGDEIAIDINGTPIPTESIQYEWNDDRGEPSVCRFALSSPPAVYGDNYLGMTLVKSATGEQVDIVLHDVEVVVKAAR
jgi:hypothetical protein